MEEGEIPLKENLSFEILPSSDEEDEFLTTSMHSKALYESFENMNISFSSEPLVEEVEDNVPEIISNPVENRILYISLGKLKPLFEQQMKCLEKSDITLNQPLGSHNNSKMASEDNMSINAKFEVDCCVNENYPDTNFELCAPTFEIIEETTNQNQLVPKTESRIRKESFADYQVDIIHDASNVENLRYSIRQNEAISNNRTISEPNTSINEFSLVRSQGRSTVEQLYPNRNNCPRRVCLIVKHSLKLYRWLQNNTCLQNLITGAQSSFHNFLNTFELEMNLMMGMEDPLKILVIADSSDSIMIQQSFCESLRGQVVISRCPEIDESTIPALPVGYNSALNAVQSKINSARSKYHSEQNTVMVSATTFIAEIYPQRWQMLTILCLDDPNLNLNLHNFTSTIPVPNEYIYQAQRLTPEDYHLKEMGLAVTLEQTIGRSAKTHWKDAQEILCGVNRSKILKSATNILAGMYGKYVDQFIQ